MGQITFRTLLLAALLALAAASPALAHTGIVATEPVEGATLQRAPDEVRLRFAGPVEAEFSPLEVYDEAGERVDLDDARLDPEDPTTVVAGLRPNLPPGTYEVRYRYTGEDGHTLNGSYNFSVSPEAVEETTAEETSAPPAASPEETTQSVAVDPASTGEDSGGGLATILLLAGLGLVALSVVAMFVLRGRGGS